MKLSILREKLKSGLDVVGLAVPRRATMPVLSGVRLEADGGGLHLLASDLTLFLSYEAGGKCEAEGGLVIPHSLLSAFVASSSDGLVNLESLSPTRLKAQSGGNTIQLSGSPLDDFPPIPACEAAAVPFTLSVSELRKAADLVSLAMAVSRERPVLNSMCIRAVTDESGDGVVSFVAADGYRLTVYNSSARAGNFTAIVPAETVNVISRLCRSASSEDALVLVRCAAERIEFCFEHVTCVSSLVSGTYPNYSQLIPPSFPVSATVEVARILEAVRVACVLAPSSGGIVRLRLDTDKITVSSSDAEEGNSESVIPAATNILDSSSFPDAKLPAKVAFGVDLLLPVLGRLAAQSVEELTIQISSPSSPCVVCANGVEGYTCVIMPMFVRD